MNITSAFVLDFSNEHIMLFHNSSSIQEFQDFEIKTPDDLKAYDPFFIPYKPVYTIKDYKSYAELAVKQQRLLI